MSYHSFKIGSHRYCYRDFSLPYDLARSGDQSVE